MSHEENAKWIRRGIVLVLAIVAVAAAWLYQESEPKDVPLPPVTTEYDLEVVHYHLPGNPESVQIAESLNVIARKYAKIVLVTRIDVLENPEAAKAQGATNPPHVAMMIGEEQVFTFQGLWSQEQIERKIDEILRGLKRMSKGWLPDVKGMQPASPASPVK